MENAEKPFEKLRSAALKRLGRRECSRKDLIAWLEKRGADPGAAALLVDELVAQGWVNDGRYARMLVRELLQRGKGERAIRRALKLKGIVLGDEELQELTAELGGASEVERARQVLERRYPDVAAGGCEDRKLLARAYRGLVSRGFSEDVARQAIFTRL